MAPAGGPTALRPPLETVAALGRIEPGRGVIRVAGPPRPAVVIERLLVEEGDRVRKGQELAALAGIGVQRAEVARLRAELSSAERELERNRSLRSGSVLSDSDWQALELARDVARARLQGAEAELELSTVRSPIDGQVLDIHAREGERVGGDGIAEIGDTAAMYAVAEVYETDVRRLRAGQRAEIRSAALSRPLEGEVERVGLKIGKQDTLSTDPVADADARVVEVRVRIIEPETAAALTNARVEVVFEP
jgi:HlyD family secretion protein